MDSETEFKTTREFDAYQRGYASKAAEIHIEPSPKTMSELETIKSLCAERGTTLALMNQQLESLEGKVDRLVGGFEGLIEKLDERYDKKYSAKLVEKIVYGMVGIILTAVLGAIVYLVINK